MKETLTGRGSSDMAPFDGRVIVVTGGLGFIGSALVARLKKAGAEVHTVSRRAPEQSNNTRHWQIDLSDAATVARFVSDVKPHFVFHLASHVMGAPDLHHVLPAFQSNLQTTVNLLAALAQSGIGRMITTGSLVEPEGNARVIPSSPYAAAKWAASDYARMFHALYEFPIAIARVFMVYGPGQQDETKLVPYVIRCIQRGEPPKITSGTRLIDWVFVEDVVSGLLKLAVVPGMDGKSVDLGSGSAIATKDLVDRICLLMGTDIKPAYGALQDRPMEPLRIANIEESKSMVGWSPETSLDDGIRKAIKWYEEHGASNAISIA